MTSSDLVIATVPKNAREEVRVSLTQFKGYRLASLRVFYMAEDGSMRPSKAGLVVRVERLADLIEALQKARDASEAGEAPAEGALP